jgi:hypothetical protein
MHARRFIFLAGCTFGLGCLSAFITPLSIQGLDLVWGWERGGAPLACLVGSAILLYCFGLILLDRSICAFSRMQWVPSYKRGEEDIFACSFFWSARSILHLGFGSRCLFDTTVFTRPVSLFLVFILLNEREHSTLRWGGKC